MKTPLEILRQVADKRYVEMGLPITTDKEFEDAQLDPDAQDIVRTMELYADQFKPKWISVEEHHPEFNQMCDVYTTRRGRVTNVKHEGGLEFYDNDSDNYYNKNTVTHWMPLPNPPDK